MGICTSVGIKDDKTKQIDRVTKMKQDEVNNFLKLLLLGAGECGKSTIFKQLKILQDGGGFAENERELFKYHMHYNVLSQMRTLLEARMILNEDFEKPESQESAQFILDMGRDTPWTKEVGEIIKKLWQDATVQSVFEKRGTVYQLNDTAKYFFDNIDIINDVNYIPTEQDILRVRIRSTGIEEADFKFGPKILKVIDIGGQRSERRKWIHCFDDVISVIFCASLADYDLSLREDNTQNRLQESLMLFSDVCQQRAFIDKILILFLNKTDLFEEKLPLVPLQKWQPEFEAQNIDDKAQYLETAKQFILSLFLRRTERKIFHHFTCALDTNLMSNVIQDVRNSLFRTMLASSGLY